MTSIDDVRAMFGKSAGKHISEYVPLIDKEFDAATSKLNLGDEEKNQIQLFIYATIRAETGNFSLGKEGISRHNSYTFSRASPTYDANGNVSKIKWKEEIISSSLLGRPFQRYEEGGQKKRLGNDSYGDGEKYKGRGFIQLTGQRNYMHFSTVVPGLEVQPELASDPKNAAKLIVAYVLEHKETVLNTLKDKKYAAARAIVNGKPKPGSEPHGLSEFVRAYEAGLASYNKRQQARPSYEGLP